MTVPWQHGSDANSAYRGAQGLDPEFIAELKSSLALTDP